MTKTLDIDSVSDTVGVIALDKDGILAAGSSSGGIAMKYPGRLGLAAIPLAGTWVQMNENGTGVAVVCSGIIVNKFIAVKNKNKGRANKLLPLVLQKNVAKEFLWEKIY